MINSRDTTTPGLREMPNRNLFSGKDPMLRTGVVPMSYLKIALLTFAVLLAVALFGTEASAHPNGKLGPFIASPTERARLRKTHILHRPDRFGHFYGNTLRRLHHHGRLLPRLPR